MIFWEFFSFITGFVKRCARDYLDQLFTAAHGKPYPKCGRQRIHGNCRGNRKWKQKGEKEKGKWKVLIRSDGCGLVLRSSRGTESDAVADAVGREVATPRRAAVVGAAAPTTAAQQTVRPLHSPSRVNQAGSWIEGVEVLAPLPHVAKHVI